MSGLPYDPGNAGDAIKHEWLVEVIEWLKQRNDTVDYADSFAGLPEYELTPALARRWRNELSHLRVYRIQEEALARDYYYGSAKLALRLLRGGNEQRGTVFISDRDNDRRTAFSQDFNKLEIDPRDGYSILSLEKDFDLILIDPFKNFLPTAVRYTQFLNSIWKKAERSSILIFVLNLASSPNMYTRFIRLCSQACRRTGLGAVVGTVPPLAGTGVRGESSCYSEMLLIPHRSLQQAAWEELLPLLRCATQRVWDGLHVTGRFFTLPLATDGDDDSDATDIIRNTGKEENR